MTDSESVHHPDSSSYKSKKFPYNRTVDDRGRVFREFNTAEELYGYIQGLLDAGYTVKVGWHNTYSRGEMTSRSKTKYTEVDPEWVGIVDGHEDQVRARQYGWLTPDKVSHVVISKSEE